MTDEEKKVAKTTEKKNDKSKKQETPQNSWFLDRDIVICLIVVLFFRGYVAEANYIPSESMIPTLKVSDRIIVDKISLHWRPLSEATWLCFIRRKLDTRASDGSNG